MQVKHDFSSGIRPSRDRVLESVRAIVGEQMGIAPGTIRETDALINDLGCDSLDVVEISMEVEEHFDITIPDEIGDGNHTVGDITDGVIELLARSPVD